MLIPAGGKVISIPCVAAQAHKDTNVLNDRYNMEDDVTESTNGEDEYELFAINSSKKTTYAIHSQVESRRKTGTYGNWL